MATTLLAASVLLSLSFADSFTALLAPSLTLPARNHHKSLFGSEKAQGLCSSSFQMVAENSASVSGTVWSIMRKDAINLLNSPLFLQLADGSLPPPVFVALSTDSPLFLACAVEACKASAARESHYTDNTAEIARVLDALLQEHNAHVEDWETLAKKATSRVSSPDADITCYHCGELGHSARDCPQTKVESVLASGYRNLIMLSIQDPSVTSAQLLAVSCVYSRLLSFIATSLQQADLVADTYAPWFAVHAGNQFSTPHVMADKLLDSASDSAAEGAALLPLCTQASSLFYSYVDALAIDAGLRGDPKKLDAMRQKLDAVESGFLANQDKMGAFMARLEAAQKYKKSARKED